MVKNSGTPTTAVAAERTEVVLAGTRRMPVVAEGILAAVEVSIRSRSHSHFRNSEAALVAAVAAAAVDLVATVVVVVGDEEGLELAAAVVVGIAKRRKKSLSSVVRPWASASAQQRSSSSVSEPAPLLQERRKVLDR